MNELFVNEILEVFILSIDNITFFEWISKRRRIVQSSLNQWFRWSIGDAYSCTILATTILISLLWKSIKEA
jgi:hypothetical protein